MDTPRTPDAMSKHTPLIAAAPELLDACKALREELRLIRMKDTNAVYNPTCRVLADAAIAKATGVGMSERPPLPSAYAPSIEEAIHRIQEGFNWTESPQGDEYWSTVIENLAALIGRRASDY